ncbi:MAG: DNA alkylation repair protein, partial [bacterium]
MQKLKLTEFKKDLRAKADSVRAEHAKRYFKTGPGEYGGGDIFLGLVVPDQRKIAKKYRALNRGDIVKLLQSKIHEERQVALFILVDQFLKGSESDRKEIYDLYLANAQRIN